MTAEIVEIPSTFHKRLLRRPQVLAITGLSKAGLYRQIAAGRFPEPVNIDGNAVAWRLSDVERWIDNLSYAKPRRPS